MKYLCTKKCYWGHRHWNPDSNIQKDKVYQGDKVPPENCFKPMKEGEKVKGLGRDTSNPVPLSALLPKTPQVGDITVQTDNVPVIDSSVLE
jgi:hypothetical protein